VNETNLDLKETVTKNKFVGLWRMLRTYRMMYFVALISIGLAALARAGISLLLGYFVDDVLANEQLWKIVPWISLAFIGLALVQGGLTFVSGRLAANTAESIVLQLRNYLYDHLQRLTFTYHDNMQTGELLQRATSDVDNVRRLFAEQLIGSGRIILLFLVNFIALLVLNVQLGLYSVIVIPIVVVISLYFFVKVGDVFESFQEQEAILSNRLQENVTGVRVVKAFARQKYETKRFDTDNWEKYVRGRRLTRMHATYWPSTDILCGIQMVASFYIGGRMAIDGIITPGTFIAASGLIVQIIWPIRNLGRLIADSSTGIVAFGRIQTIIKEVREPLDEGIYKPTADLKGKVQFANVNFAYSNDIPVLHNISFNVEPGQTVALLGSTGSGKSSLMSLLPRFYEYTKGHITIDDMPLNEISREYLRRQIGIVMQEPFLFSCTIRDNITYGVGRVVSDAEVEAAARAADVHDVIMTFPKGYQTMVGERGVTLSGGQKQRVTLARTLLKKPSILILDDATSAVDTETEAAIRSALNDLTQSRTTFIIAHRIQSVMTADLVLVLDNGRIVQRGTHETLMAESGIYCQTYDLQARIEEELEMELATASPTPTFQTDAVAVNRVQ
jgi:ATP-binding cassette, subfamily B, bacterial